MVLATFRTTMGGDDMEHPLSAGATLFPDRGDDAKMRIESTRELNMRLEGRRVFAEPWVRAGLAALLGAALLASACSGGGGPEAPIPDTTEMTAATPTVLETSADPTHVGMLRVSASRCTLDAAKGSISPGLVSLTAVNETDALAGFDMWRIADGSTYAQLAAHIKKESRLAKAGMPGLGHPGYVGDLIRVMLQAGESGIMVGTVHPGTYGIVCLRMFEQVGDLRPAGVLGPVEVE